MRLRSSALVLLGLLSLIAIHPVQAQVAAAPALMNFQGRLSKPDGTPFADGTVNLQFSLFTQASGGTLYWLRNLPNIPVRNGTFSVRLDFTGGYQNGATLASLFSAPALYIEVRINGGDVLLPRQQFVTVAYAMKANSVPDASIGSGQLANDFASLAKVSGGALASNGTSTALNDKLLTFRGVGDSNHGLGYFGSYGGSALDGPALFGFNGGVLGYQNTRVLTWTNQGRVGIGIAAPGSKLDVSGTESVGIRYLRTDARDARIQVGDNTKTWSLATGWAVAGDLSIIEEGVAGDRFYIQKATGNVGIGTISPGARLDVAGTARMTGFALPTGAGAGKVLVSDAAGLGTWGQLTGAGIANGTITADKLAAGVGSGWSLTGNSGTNPASNFLGTTDDQPLMFKVNNLRALQMQHASISSASTGAWTGNNVLGGYWLNSITAGATGATVFGGVKDGSADWFNRVTDIAGTVSGGARNRAGNDNDNVADARYATVGGGYLNIASGQYATVGGGNENIASSVSSTVGGGKFNRANSGDYATVGGGQSNIASGVMSTVGGGNQNTASGAVAIVGGGELNTASGVFATVPGGTLNTALGRSSFAAGFHAQANHDGAFVWGDGTNTDFASTAENQFNIRAAGGVRIFSNPGASTGVLLAAGGGGWSNASDRNLKTNFQNVDTLAVLEKLIAMPLTTWNYKANTDIKHIGPIAQDFFVAFGGLGMDDKHIDTVDADGVAFAAIQGLNRKLETQNAELKQQNTEVKKRLQAEVTGLKAENAELKARLEALEAAVQRLTAQPK